MANAQDESYAAMISALQTFVSEAEEECSVMDQAGQDCVDNTDNDAAALKSSASLSKCVSNIRSAVAEINNIAAALQQELDDIHEAAARANFD